jgi:hypothetical protein
VSLLSRGSHIGITGVVMYDVYDVYAIGLVRIPFLLSWGCYIPVR